MEQKITDAINNNKSQIDQLLKDYNMADIKIIEPAICEQNLYFAGPDIHFLVTFQQKEATSSNMRAFRDEMTQLFKSKDIRIKIHTKNSLLKEEESLSASDVDDIIKSALTINDSSVQENLEKKNEKDHIKSSPPKNLYSDTTSMRANLSTLPRNISNDDYHRRSL